MNNKHYKVAIVGGCLSSLGGGVPRSVSHQALALKDSGHHVTLFAGYNKQYPFTPNELGIDQCQTFISRLWGPSVLGLFPGALWELWKRASSFDIIHLNGGWNLTTFIGGLIARSRQVPYIISCRSHYGDYHFSRRPLLKKLLFWIFERRNIKNAFAIHVTADWEAKTSWRAAQLAQRIIKIPNPVNLSDFEDPPSRTESRKHLKLDQEGFYIVHLGRLGKQKNLSFLIRAFHQAQLGSTAQLILIGPPEPQEKNILINLSKSLNIESQLTFIDFAKGRERCHWLAAADLFALPSFDENFCIVAVESVASGTPCLLSPHIGVTEFLPRELAQEVPLKLDAWIKALKNAYAIRRKQQLPRKDALKMFSNESIGTAWLEFYKTKLKT